MGLGRGLLDVRPDEDASLAVVLLPFSDDIDSDDTDLDIPASSSPLQVLPAEFAVVFNVTGEGLSAEIVTTGAVLIRFPPLDSVV